MLKLILLFTVIPLLEITLLIKISHIFGTLYAVILVATTGLIGAFLSKKQGASVILKIRKSLNDGMMPANSLIDGLLILIGGVFLITPGIITDIAGFCCIIPGTRKKVKKLTKDKLNRLISTGTFHFSDNTSKESKEVNIYKDYDNKN